jgi:hypothetical protein
MMIAQEVRPMAETYTVLSRGDRQAAASQTFRSIKAARRFARRVKGLHPSWDVHVARYVAPEQGEMFVPMPVEEVR